MIDVLTREISGDPILVQVAKNGIWEDAWKIDYSEGQPSSEEVKMYTGGEDEVAFEVFFNTKAGQSVFLGARYSPRLTVVDSATDFLETAFSSIWHSENPTPESLVKALSIDLTPDPSAVAIGVTNWWKTFGECVIWKNGDPKSISRQEVTGRLAEHPLLLRNDKNYAAMEFAYAQDDLHPEHWLGLQLSRKVGDNFILDYDRLFNNLNIFLNITAD